MAPANQAHGGAQRHGRRGLFETFIVEDLDLPVAE